MAQPRCPTCGRFMRRLKLLERIRIQVSEELVSGSSSGRTHICRYEEFTHLTAVWEHINKNKE